MILLNSRATVALIGLLAACSGPAAQPLYNYSDKSVEQLLTLSDSEDAHKRSCAALFIGIRYRNPKLLLVNAPIIKSNSPPPELPMPAKVIDRLSYMLTNDSRPQVRSSVLSALSRIKYRCDTTPIIEQALADKDVFLRLRAADELVSIHEDYKERLGGRVIKTILESIETSQDTETLGRAAFILGRIGPEAKEALPWLEKLTSHENSSVRRRAAEALAKLKGTKLPQEPDNGSGPGLGGRVSSEAPASSSEVSKSKRRSFTEILAEVDPWPGDPYPESRGPFEARVANYARTNWNRLVAAARLLQAGEPSIVEGVLAEFQRLHHDTYFDGRLFVVMRVLFDLPENRPLTNFAGFGGWKAFSGSENFRTNSAWPITWNQGNPHFVGGFTWFEGRRYNAATEYRQFESKFPKRDLATFKE